MCYSRMDYGMEEQLRRLREEEEREEQREAATQQRTNEEQINAQRDREFTRA